MVETKEVKERTAISLLLGLRNKFAKETKTSKTYTAIELHLILSEALKKLDSDLYYKETLALRDTTTKPNSKEWQEVEENIERSKIRRYNWTSVFGRSLTKEILSLKNKGLSSDDTFNEILNHDRVLRFLDDNEPEARNIVKNLKISVNARYVEDNTATKIREKEE